MANDNWETPLAVMEYLKDNHDFEPTIDACASSKNKKCEHHYTEHRSFLKVNPAKITGQKIWCNPPYSKPLPFVKQCYLLSQNNNEVFMLLNMDSSTEWFMEIDSRSNATVMPVTGGRIGFVVNGVQKRGNDRAQVFIRFAPEKQRTGQANWQTVPHSKIMEYNKI